MYRYIVLPMVISLLYRSTNMDVHTHACLGCVRLHCAVELDVHVHMYMYIKRSLVITVYIPPSSVLAVTLALLTLTLLS